MKKTVPLAASLLLATVIAARPATADSVSSRSRRTSDGTLSEHRDASATPGGVPDVAFYPPPEVQPPPQIPPGFQPPPDVPVGPPPGFVPPAPLPPQMVDTEPPAQPEVPVPENENPEVPSSPAPAPPPPPPVYPSARAAPGAAGQKPDVYTYRDQNGTINFTNRPDRIPPQYKAKVEPYPIFEEQSAPPRVGEAGDPSEEAPQEDTAY